MINDRRTRDKYWIQKSGAKRRGVPFLLTFHEWFKIWNDSGKWEERGSVRGKYCMSRFNDLGPYVVGNVYIQTFGQNTSEKNRLQFKGRIPWNKNIPRTPEEKLNISNAKIGKKMRLVSCLVCKKQTNIFNLTRNHKHAN